MFDVKVDLVDNELNFDPQIGCTSRENGIKDIILKIINDFISISIQMNRLDTGSGDYLVEIKDQFELFGAMQVITDHLNEITNETDKFISQYNDHSFLWKDTLEESFLEFLDTGEDPKAISHKKINDEGEEEEDESFYWMAEKILNGVQTKKPNLEKFDEKITYFTKVKAIV